MKSGAFDNLPGAGKPIRWTENSLAPEDEKLMFDLLQKNGFTIPWIEKGMEIRRLAAQFRQALKTWWEVEGSQSQNNQPDPILLEALAELNRKILDYNRSVPVESLQVSFLTIESETAHLK